MNRLVYQAIADPSRRRMLDMLAQGERTASQLGSPFSMSQPAVSQHLRVLRKAGLVTVQQDGRHRRYRLRPQPLHEVADWMAGLDRFWHQRLHALQQLLDQEEP